MLSSSEEGHLCLGCSSQAVKSFICCLCELVIVKDCIVISTVHTIFGGPLHGCCERLFPAMLAQLLATVRDRWEDEWRWWSIGYDDVDL